VPRPLGSGFLTARRDNRGVLRIGRLVVALCGAIEGVYFSFVALYLLLYVFAGSLGNVFPALAFGVLAAGALGGAAGTFTNRRWGAILLAVTSGLALAFWIVWYPGPWWLGVWGLPTILAIGYVVASWRARPSPA
jgi:hypothetical protein